ncbi:MAG: alpha amylase C-terminal domain-containing protein, partial [Acidobacteriota bacterium]
GSLLNKMPGDDWKKFANLRLLLAYQAAVPGKKLLFMGGEIGQWAEWDHDSSLQWHLLEEPAHAGVQRWAAQLNRLHASELALHELDFDPAGFEWLDFRDSPQSVLAFLRVASNEDAILAVFNFTPVPRHGYRLGVPHPGRWTEIASGDRLEYGGSGIDNGGGVEAEAVRSHGRPFSVLLNLPPLAAIFLKGAAPKKLLDELSAEVAAFSPSPRARGEGGGEGQSPTAPSADSESLHTAEILEPVKP